MCAIKPVLATVFSLDDVVQSYKYLKVDMASIKCILSLLVWFSQGKISLDRNQLVTVYLRGLYICIILYFLIHIACLSTQNKY